MSEITDLKDVIANAKGMVTDDSSGRRSDASDFLATFGSATERNGCSTVAADWFEAEPAAGGTRARRLHPWQT